MAKMSAEMPNVTGQEVRGACVDGGQYNGNIFFREGNAAGQFARDCLELMKMLRESRQTSKLILVTQIDSRLFDCVAGGAKRRAF
jgi:hypothetical protein